jgi:hypothetical protein
VRRPLTVLGDADEVRIVDGQHILARHRLVIRKRFRKKMRLRSPCSSAAVLWSGPAPTIITRGHCRPRFQVVTESRQSWPDVKNDGQGRRCMHFPLITLYQKIYLIRDIHSTGVPPVQVNELLD